jgi:hypothetical protein
MSSLLYVFNIVLFTPVTGDSMISCISECNPGILDPEVADSILEAPKSASPLEGIAEIVFSFPSDSGLPLRFHILYIIAQGKHDCNSKAF